MKAAYIYIILAAILVGFNVAVFVRGEEADLLYISSQVLLFVSFIFFFVHFYKRAKKQPQ